MARPKQSRSQPAGPAGSLSAQTLALRMKNRAASATPAKKPEPSPGAGSASAALDWIVKHAYRRHARGRIAREAMASCLGA